MPIKAIVSRDQCIRIQELYEKLDNRGAHVWSQARLAKDFGLSEGTVYRIIRRMGAYADLPETGEISADEAGESAARLAALLNKEESPASPQVDLQGPGSAIDRMLALTAKMKEDAGKGDSMINELNSEGKENGKG